MTCALDATLDNVRASHKSGSNVLLTHHPVYIKAPDAFKPAESLTPSSSSVVYEAAHLGVSVISMHTNLDRSAAVSYTHLDVYKRQPHRRSIEVR